MLANKSLAKTDKLLHISAKNHRTLEASAMTVRPVIISEFEQVARQQAKNLAPLSDNLVLLDSGLDSLCFAIIVARLEDTLGFDPFSAEEEGDFPVTLGDFVRFYEHAAR